ncbi:tudor domain-containing 6-like isoform X2 [Ornithodoros turicata]|uniref:tudor domain-containing 6-like isoform X2 n=1 Tax=Ornithodoros turicata TaxID=34597 RepID=UPI003139FA90
MAKLSGTWAYTRGQEELQTRLRKLHEEKDLIVNLLDHMIDRMNMMVDRTAGITNINQFMHQFQDATITMNQFFLKLFKIHILLTDEEYMDASVHTSQMSIAYPVSNDRAHSATSQTSERVTLTVHGDYSPDTGVTPDPHQSISVTCSNSSCPPTSIVARSADSPVTQIVSPVTSADCARTSDATNVPTPVPVLQSTAYPVTVPLLSSATEVAKNLSPFTVTELHPSPPNGVNVCNKSQAPHNAPARLPSGMPLSEHKPRLEEASDAAPNTEKSVPAKDGDTAFMREKCGAGSSSNTSVNQLSIPRLPRTQPKCASKLPSLSVNQDGVTATTSMGSKSPVALPEGVCVPSSTNSTTFLVVPPPVVEVTGCPVDVVLSHYKSPNEFFLQLKSSNETLQMLLESLHSLYSTKVPELNFEIKVGMYCVAYYPVDTYWYRAKVLQVQPGHVKVSYIDFGNSERVERHNVHPLDASLGSIPAQAICCAIRGIKPMGNQGMWDQQAVQTFKHKLQGEVSLRAAFYEQDLIKGRYSVELLVDSNGPNDRVTLNLAEHFVSLCLAEEVECLDDISSVPVCNSSSNKSPVPKAYQHSAQPSVPQPLAAHFSTNVPPPVHPEGNFLVTLSVVFSPSDFFGQLMDSNSKVQSIERLQEQLNEYGPHAQPVDETHIVPGSHWVCLYSTDQHWYRVRVLDVVQEAQQLKYKVFYIDYGNRGTVTAAELRPLTADLAKLPAFALHMALAIVSPVGEHWSQAANQLFVEKTGFDDSLFAEQKRQKKDVLGTVTEVVLWNRRNPRAGVNVNIFLVENNLAVIKP